MRIFRPAASAIVATLCIISSLADAIAFSASIAVSRDKTTAFVSPNAVNMTPYGATIHQLILAEIKRTHLPFALAAPFVFLVRFDLNRRGQLVDLKLLQGSNLAEANEYAELIVRRAAREFPPPPNEVPGAKISFVLPLSMQIR